MWIMNIKHHYKVGRGSTLICTCTYFFSFSAQDVDFDNSGWDGFENLREKNAKSQTILCIPKTRSTVKSMDTSIESSWSPSPLMSPSNRPLNFLLPRSHPRWVAVHLHNFSLSTIVWHSKLIWDSDGWSKPPESWLVRFCCLHQQPPAIACPGQPDLTMPSVWFTW